MRTSTYVVKALSIGIAVAMPLAANAALEEIIVTAQKRSESLQDVPIAIAAYSSESLKALGIVEASQLANVTPGLNSGSQAGSNRNYYLRGVGTADLHLTAASAVGQYYDGVSLTSGFQARAALFDMERVEILKGPQNTLYGLNTTGGAINYISNKPEVGVGTNGSVSIKFGSDSQIGSEAAVGFDVSDTVAARLAMQTNKNDGPFVSTTDGRDYGGDDMGAYRASLVWVPNDRAQLNVNIHGMQNENNGSAVKALGTRDPDGLGGVCVDFGPGELDFERDTDCLSRNGGGTGEVATDPSTGDWESITSNIGHEDIESSGYYFDFSYDLSWATLNVITAFDNLDVKVAFDSDGTGIQLLHQFQEDDRDISQHEVRLTSSADGAFRWIAGAYMLDEDAQSYTAVRSPKFANGTRNPNVQLDHSKENLGIYLQGEYDINDVVTVTAGVRWSDEEIRANYLPSSPLATSYDSATPLFSADVAALVLAQANPDDANQDAGGYDTRRQVSQALPNEDVGYTLKLDWKLTEDSLLYASYSKGFKGSAADTRAVFALVPVPNLQTGLEASRLEPESLKAVELGYKASYMNNAVQIDGAVFSYVYENLQQFSTVAGVPTLVNAPESEISGFDGSVKYASDNGLYIDLGVSLLDTEVTVVAGSQFVEGGELANSPEFSMAATVSQELTLSNGALLTLMGNISHTGDTLRNTIVSSSSETVAARTQPAYTLLNANVTYNFGDQQQYSVALFGNNLTDEHYCGFRGLNEGNTTYESGLNGFSYAVSCRVDRGSTRTFGASFSYDF